VGGERIEVVTHDRSRLEEVRDILSAIGAGAASIEEHARRVTVPSEGGAGRLINVVRQLDDAGITIDDIALRRPTLDDVFLSLTGHQAQEKQESAA
jgi:ABC-2 type transport system ATP-binding protein